MTRTKVKIPHNSSRRARRPAVLPPRDPWAHLLVDAIQGSEREAFTSSLVSQRWFGAKGRAIVRVRLLDYALLPKVPTTTLLLLVGVDFREGPAEIYAFPLAIVPQTGGTLSTAQEQAPVILVLRDRRGKAEVRDATGDLAVGRALVEGIRDEAEWTSVVGSFTGRHTTAGRLLLSEPVQQATRFSGEQSNTSVIYDRRLILKMIRKLAHGVNPDFEVLEFLASRSSYRHVPLLVGHIQYDGALGGKRDGRFSATAAVLQTFVPNQGDAWQYALKQLGALLEDARDPGVMPPGEQTPAFVRTHAAGFLDDMRRLGEITGELHKALSLDSSPPAFRPEPITHRDVSAWRRGMTSQIRGVVRELRQLPGNRLRELGLTPGAVTGLERACMAKLAPLSMLLIAPVQKIRHHGDYHLGQVLKTDTDFVILDFEGEPARPLTERRQKACALKDVAGMLRSFDYAASMAARRMPLAGEASHVVSRAWAQAASGSFLEGYLATAVPGKVGFLPPTRKLVERILWVYLLDKAVYELRYELQNRVDWVSVPLDGLRRLLNHAG